MHSVAHLSQVGQVGPCYTTIQATPSLFIIVWQVSTLYIMWTHLDRILAAWRRFPTDIVSLLMNDCGKRNSTSSTSTLHTVEVLSLSRFTLALGPSITRTTSSPLGMQTLHGMFGINSFQHSKQQQQQSYAVIFCVACYAGCHRFGEISERDCHDHGPPNQPFTTETETIWAWRYCMVSLNLMVPHGHVCMAHCWTNRRGGTSTYSKDMLVKCGCLVVPNQ